MDVAHVIRLDSGIHHGGIRRSIRCEPAEESMLLVVYTRREEEHVRAAGPRVIPKLEPPETIDGDWIVGEIGELSKERACRWIKGIDPAIAEVAHQDVVAETTEVIGSKRDSPW